MSRELVSEARGGLVVVDDPHVLEVLELGVGEESPEDRLRVAQHAIAAERLVTDELRPHGAASEVRSPLGGSGALQPRDLLTEPTKTRRETHRHIVSADTPGKPGERAKMPDRARYRAAIVTRYAAPRRYPARLRIPMG